MISAQTTILYKEFENNNTENYTFDITAFSQGTIS